MKNFLFSFILLITFSSNSQNYFIEGKDTTFCKNLKYDLTIQSYLSSISYTDMDGQGWQVKGRKNLVDVTSMYIGGQTIDKIPQKADKPDGYVKWANRVVNGKLIVNYYDSVMSSYNTGRSVTTSITKFFIKMPDGTFYNINSGSDMKKHIIPYLKECEAFNSAYNGDFRSAQGSFM
jgi:hypothetical protein